ncbi:dermonecrotic toxin SPH-like, partial [Rhipicephalus microplus]|uniref:dermonecrotic toxin SPH-like n=1 Tax=Rhipicephalus microplus TaxID=6941 RepID=UPI003F6BCD3A
RTFFTGDTQPWKEKYRGPWLHSYAAACFICAPACCRVPARCSFVHVIKFTLQEERSGRRLHHLAVTRNCERRNKQSAFCTDDGIYKEHLTLLFLDLKVTNVLPQYKYHAGVDIAEKLIRHLWSGVYAGNAMNVLLSIRSVRDGDVLRGALHTIYRIMPLMLSKIGVDVSNTDQPIDAIRDLYLKLGITGHRWQGDGATNCVSYLRPPRRLYSIIRNRQSQAPYHYVEKAYQWTVDLPEQLRGSLRKGVDAIITNRPDRLAAILGEDKFRDVVRTATVYDNPWTRFDDLTHER